MKLNDVAAYLSEGRIVDLTNLVEPGKAIGPSAGDARRFEIEHFVYGPGEFMHYIEMESHISTHIEAPSHFIPARYGKDVKAKTLSELELTKFFGPAVLVDCSDLPPRTGIGVDILKKLPIEEHDIVLIGVSNHRGTDRCFSTKEGMEYLIQKKIKMIGWDENVRVEDQTVNPPPGNLQTMDTHDLMLSNEIPVIEGLGHLSELKKTRFLFFAFPARLGGLESFPIRAVAIEEK